MIKTEAETVGRGVGVRALTRLKIFIESDALSVDLDQCAIKIS